MQVKLLTENATLPNRGSEVAAGLDLFASEDVEIPPWGQALVSTGIAIALPNGTYGRVAPRSGLSTNEFIDVGAGVIDADYRGEVKVLLRRFSSTPFEIKVGAKIAQLIVTNIQCCDPILATELVVTTRGESGFGSTGK